MSTQLEKLNDEIAKESEKLKKIANSFETTSRKSSPEVAGQQLLEAFLEDKPFDRYLFGLQPVKEAFIDAAFKTGDMEIVTTCFGFVEQSMSKNAFQNMIKDKPQYMNVYQMMHKSWNKPLTKDVNFYVLHNVDEIKKMAENENNKLVKAVLEDHVTRLNAKTPDYPVEEVDKKWGTFKNACVKHNYTSIYPSDLLSKGGIFATKWKTAVDPYQAARMSYYWRAPPQLIQRFAKDIKDPKEKQIIENLPVFK